MSNQQHATDELTCLRYALGMSIDETSPELVKDPLKDPFYKELQLMLMFKEVGKIEDSKKRSDQVADWIDANGQLFHDWFTEHNRGKTIVADNDRLKSRGKTRQTMFINRALRRFKVWRKERISKEAKQKEPR